MTTTTVDGHVLVTIDRLLYVGWVARTTKASLAAQGTEAFTHALTSLGHPADAVAGGGAGDVVVSIDGIDVPVTVVAASVITPDTVARLVAGAKPHPGVTAVVVGDLVTAAAREALRDAGWSWLDRRGHLVLRATGVHLDTDVPADQRLPAEGPTRVISGAAGISWAAALLLSPQDPPSMRSVARRVSLSHSAIVAASKRLKDASLVRADGRPLVPELFWALADEWHPRPVALAELPSNSDERADAGLGVNTGSDGPGWAIGGTVGAVAWGAPVAVGSAYPPDFYVPSAVELRQATRRFGEVSRFEERACTVAVAPTPLVCTERYERAVTDWDRWGFAHGLFAALDLAQDRARGAEILAEWDPTDFTRVW